LADRVFLVLTEDSWADRSTGPAASLALADLAGFRTFDPNRTSDYRYVVGCDSVDLTFYFSLRLVRFYRL
jgi:hypothetical protein